MSRTPPPPGPRAHASDPTPEGADPPEVPQVAPDGERGFQRIFSVLFSSYESVSKLALFSVLCIVGNLETFGLANFWPILLHDQFPSKSATSNPAMQLLLLRLWGVPASVLTFFVLSLPFLGHRLGLCWGPTPGGPYVVEQEGWQNGPAVRGGGTPCHRRLRRRRPLWSRCGSGCRCSRQIRTYVRPILATSSGDPPLPSSTG